MPISDKVQALIVLAAGILITLSSTQVPADTPDRNTVILIINFAGWIGIAIKEVLGAKTPSFQAPTITPPVSKTSSTPTTPDTQSPEFTPDS